MEVQDSTIQDAFNSGGKIQYRLPHFQREYAWERRNWDMLFEDVLALYNAPWEDPEKAPKHFLGTIVVQFEGKHGLSLNYYKLVDGQQRLVTASLLLCALRDHVGRNSRLFNEINGFLVNEGQDGDFYYKVVPSQMYGDRRAYSAIISGYPNGAETESQIPLAFDRFVSRLESVSQTRELDVERLVNCIVSCMEIVHVDLNKGESPHKIFESLNAKGKPLSQADLVRNFIAMRLTTDSQEEVFNKLWLPIEDRLHEKRKTGTSGTGELTAFVRHYLCMKTGKVPNLNRVYETFRTRVKQQFDSDQLFIGEIEEMHRFSCYYDKLLRPNNEHNCKIEPSLKRLERADSVTAYPLAMHLYDLHERRQITTEDFVDTLDILENLIIRVFLGRGATAGLNRLFPSFVSRLQPPDIRRSLAEIVSRNPRYPSDARIRDHLQSFAFHSGKHRAKLVYVLERIDESLFEDGDGYAVLNSRATVEHIMPQTLSDEWRTHLGDAADHIHREFVNSIGNLTLVTQQKNSSLSADAFEIKRQALSDHVLRLNSEYFSRNISRWDDRSICDRSNYLTDIVLKLWPSVRPAGTVTDFAGKKPVRLVINGAKYPVSHWKQVRILAAERVAELVLNSRWESIADGQKHLSRNTQDQYRWTKLSNGWWVMHFSNANDAVQFVADILHAAGLDDADWHVEVE